MDKLSEVLGALLILSMIINYNLLGALRSVERGRDSLHELLKKQLYRKHEQDTKG